MANTWVTWAVSIYMLPQEDVVKYYGLVPGSPSVHYCFSWSEAFELPRFAGILEAVDERVIRPGDGPLDARVSFKVPEAERDAIKAGDAFTMRLGRLLLGFGVTTRPLVGQSVLLQSQRGPLPEPLTRTND